MANVKEENFKATNRDHHLVTEDAYITTRLAASLAPAGSNEQKIHKLTGNLSFLTKTITAEKEDTEFYNEYLSRTMQTPESLNGDADHKHQCTFMNIAFANTLKKSGISKKEQADQAYRIYGDSDIENMIWCSPHNISNALLACRLIAVSYTHLTLPTKA